MSQKEKQQFLNSLKIQIDDSNEEENDAIIHKSSTEYDNTQFLEYIQKHRKKTDTFDLGEFLQSFSLKMQDELWKTVLERVDAVVASRAYVRYAEAQQLHDEQHSSEDIPEDISRKCKDDLSFLMGIAVLCECAVKISEETTKFSDTFNTIVNTLHSLLLEVGVNDEGYELQNAISAVCEGLYQLQPENTDYHSLVPQTVSYLLARSLEHNEARISDIKRVYSMRNALLLLDFNDASIESIQELLLHCVISPLYLSSAEGRRFLIFIFNIHSSLTELLHTAVVPQIASSKASVLDAFAEIYYKAWKNASGQILLKLEYSCIQDLMYHCVHARTFALFSNIRKVLDGFHSQKKQRGVDEMLLRLYEPILFRSLSVANALVRRNAAAIFIDAFPLTNPELPIVEVDNLLQKQFNHLKELLTDETVAVRCIGVEGVCRVLTLFWELIPPETTHALLLCIVKKMAFDGSSSSVRVAVFKGLSYLLDNHLSHAVLKGLLPHLSPLIHDVSQAVRASFVMLLNRIKAIRAIRFFDIVSVDDLLLRLAIEPPTIGKKITALLLNSYLPYNKPASTQLARYLDLVGRSPIAARKFYTESVHLIPSTAAWKLIRTLSAFLSKCRDIRRKVLAQEDGVVHNVDASDSESESTPESESDSDNDDSMSRLLKSKRKPQQKRKRTNQRSKANQSLDTTNDDNDESSDANLQKVAMNTPLMENTIEIQSLIIDELAKAATKEQSRLKSKSKQRKPKSKSRSSRQSKKKQTASDSEVSEAESHSDDEDNDEDESFHSKLVSEFTGDTLHQLLTAFNTPRVSAAVWRIAKHLPQQQQQQQQRKSRSKQSATNKRTANNSNSGNGEVLLHNSLSTIEKMFEDAAVRNDFAFVLECVCQWGNTEKVLKLIETHLSPMAIDEDIAQWLPLAEESSSATKKKKQKKSKDMRPSDKSRRKRQRSGDSESDEESASESFEMQCNRACIAIQFLTVLMANGNTRHFITDAASASVSKRFNAIVDILHSIASTTLPAYFAHFSGGNAAANKSVRAVFERFVGFAFHTYPKLLLYRVSKTLNEMHAEHKSNRSTLIQKLNEFFFRIPEDIQRLLTLYNDEVLPALFTAGLTESKTQPPKKKKPTKKKKRTANNESESDDESESETEANGMTSAVSLAVNVSATMCMFVADCISLGIIRANSITGGANSGNSSASSETTQSVISTFLYAFMQRDMRVLTGNMLPNLIKIVFLLLQGGWNASSPLQLFHELLQFCATNHLITTTTTANSNSNSSEQSQRSERNKKYIMDMLRIYLFANQKAVQQQQQQQQQELLEQQPLSVLENVQREYLRLGILRAISDINKHKATTAYSDFLIETIRTSPKIVKLFLAQIREMAPEIVADDSNNSTADDQSQSSITRPTYQTSIGQLLHLLLTLLRQSVLLKSSVLEELKELTVFVRHQSIDVYEEIETLVDDITEVADNMIQSHRDTLAAVAGNNRRRDVTTSTTAEANEANNEEEATSEETSADNADDNNSDSVSENESTTETNTNETQRRRRRMRSTVA